MSKGRTAKAQAFRIVKYMKMAGTYEEFFQDAIDHLAQLYMDLEAADAEWRESGGTVMTTQVDQKGNEWAVMNPALKAKYQVLHEVTVYEAKLGLTPADHRKIMAAANNEKRESSLGAALRVLSG